MPSCFTVDVENFYDPASWSVFGQDAVSAVDTSTGLDRLEQIVDACTHQDRPRLTLFVVGSYAATVQTQMSLLIRSGHELASHGPDHGHLPSDRLALTAWLRSGRVILEDRYQVPVAGFRSPRFELPRELTLRSYRECLAEAGYAYVSDRAVLGQTSPLLELPVTIGRARIGGGSYQRALPRRIVRRLIVSHARGGTPVLYYHSYDFGVGLPSPWRSKFVASQVLARSRIEPVFRDLLGRLGSVTCGEALGLAGHSDSVPTR